MAKKNSALRNEAKLDERLGSKLAEYPVRHRFLETWVSLFLEIMAFLLGVGGLVWTGYSAYQIYYYHGPAAVGQELLLPLALSVLFSLLGILGFLRTARRFKYKAVLFENGLAIKDRAGEKTLLWNEVSSIRSQYRRDAFRAKANTIIARQDGERIVLDGSLKDVDTLVKRIRENTIALIYKRYHPAFIDNTPLAFGPIRLTREVGIQFQQKSIPWQQVHRAKVERGRFVLDLQQDGKNSRTLEIPVSLVPNIEILLALINDCSGTR